MSEEGAPGFVQGAPSCAPGCGLGGRLGATDVRRLEGRKRRAAPPPADPPPPADVGGALSCSWLLF